MPNKSPRVTVWNEFYVEREDDAARKAYPSGIHAAVRDGLVEHGVTDVATATFDEPQHGLTTAVLDRTDVLVWWGHRRHEEFDSALVEDLKARIWAGMGLLVLHSGHFSKIFRALMGTRSDTPVWNEDGETERIWVIAPEHPIASGLGRSFEIPREEMYGEPMELPRPDQLIFISWFESGEVFRSGLTWQRGRGRVFYFRPGHESFPTYYIPEVKRVIANGVRWAAEPKQDL